MQVKYVAGVGFAAWRTAQQQGHLAVRLRVLGQIVIHNQHVFALPHKIFTDSAAGVRRDIQQGSRVGRGGRYHNGIIHSAVIGQRFDYLGYRTLFLAHGYINTNAAFRFRNVLLVDDSIYRNSRFTGLAVADNQFALAFTYRHERVNGFQARLQRLFDRLAVNNTGGYNVQRHIFNAFNGAFAV